MTGSIWMATRLPLSMRFMQVSLGLALLGCRSSPTVIIKFMKQFLKVLLQMFSKTKKTHVEIFPVEGHGFLSFYRKPACHCKQL